MHRNDADFGYGSNQLHAPHINTCVTGNGEEKEMEHYHSCKETQYHNSAFFWGGGVCKMVLLMYNFVCTHMRVLEILGPIYDVFP